MVPFFIQIKCHLGKSYEVANALADAEIASEIYSTAGDFDLLVKFYVDDGDRYRPFRQREGAGDPRHPGHPHDHHLQGVRVARFGSVLRMTKRSRRGRRACGFRAPRACRPSWRSRQITNRPAPTTIAAPQTPGRHLAEHRVAEQERPEDRRVVERRHHRGRRVAVALGQQQVETPPTDADRRSSPRAAAGTADPAERQVSETADRAKEREVEHDGRRRLGVGQPARLDDRAGIGECAAEREQRADRAAVVAGRRAREERDAGSASRSRQGSRRRPRSSDRCARAPSGRSRRARP